MSDVSQNRMCTHALVAAIAVALSSLAAAPAYAANRVDLHGLNINKVNSQKALVAGTTSQRHARMLGMDRESGLVEVRHATIAGNGARNYRYQQTFRGIPVFGEHVIVSEKQDGSVRLLYGRMVTGLASELPATKPRVARDTALAIAKRAALGSRVTAMRTRNEKVRQMIYIDGDRRAHLSYLVDYFADMSGGGSPTRPQVIVDANTGKVLRRWEGLTTDQVGTGPGGNNKTGQYEYGTDYGFNDVAVSGANCTMNNANVRSIDLDGPGGNANNTPFVYPCFRNTYKAINGGFSPINDAHFFGGVVFNMYADYLGEAPLTFQLTMKVHYATRYENAFWDGSSMTFGDGFTTFYPLVGLDVSAHEVSHGYTEQNSGLIYDNQSGGMNEAFSDMAGEAADFFFRGAADFEVGAEIFKAPGEALRYMYDPPLDGRSIDNFADYNDSIDVHYSSGIYNKAFWALATTAGWDVESAFRTFANANRDYWVPNETMLQGACKVEQAATDNGYDATDVHAAFVLVGLDCGGGPSTQTYTNDTDYNIPDPGLATSVIGVSGRTGNAPADAKVHVEILHPFRGDLSINLVAPDGTARVLKRARPRDGADNVIATYTVNLSSEALNGNWKLRVRDRTSGNTGHIDTWSITF
jgi:pseudolysin/vibriolysin